MDRRPIAYLRRSRVDPERTDLSWEVQEQSVRELAERHGDLDGLVVMSDWNRSGSRLKRRLRPEYQKMLEMIRRGEVSAVYSYSLSRLSRSVIDLSELAHIAAEAGVPVRLAKESIPDWTTPYGRLVVNVLGSVAEMEYELARERARDTAKIREQRGDRVGPAPYGMRVVEGRLVDDADERGHLHDVVETYERTRSFQGTARELTAAGIPTKLGKAAWGATTVRQVIERYAPSLIRRTVARGRPGVGGFRLSGLLVCPCGARLTGSRQRGKYVTYTCRRAATNPRHTRPHAVSERRVMGAVQSAVDLLKRPKVSAEQLDAREEKLGEQRVRVLDMYQGGAIDKGEFQRRIGKVDFDLDEVRRSRVPQRHEPRSLEGEPREVNAWLREVFERIEMSERLRPQRFVYALPEEVDWDEIDSSERYPEGYLDP